MSILAMTAITQASWADDPAMLECTFQNRTDRAELISSDCLVLKLQVGSCVSFSLHDADNNLAAGAGAEVNEANSIGFNINGFKDAYTFSQVSTSGSSTESNLFATYAATASHPDGIVSLKCKQVAPDVIQSDVQAGKCTNFPMACL